MKAKEVQQESKQKTEQERKLIMKLQNEAQKLEAMEEQLIKRLQGTQEMEREAFKELEEAMIAASMPKKERNKVVQDIHDDNHDI